jgi:hypothetical protein
VVIVLKKLIAERRSLIEAPTDMVASGRFVVTKTMTSKLSQLVLTCLVYFDDRKTVKKVDYGR